MEPGETIEMGLRLTNNGDTTAIGVTAIISHNGEFIDIEHDIIVFPDMEPGEASDSETLFRFSISREMEFLNTLSFLVRVVSQEGQREYPLKIELLKHADNPVFRGDPEGWDSVGVRSPSLLIVDGQLTCWYAGFFGVGLAYSNDGGETWDKEEEPVLDVGDNFPVSDVSVIYHNNEYLMAILITECASMNGFHIGTIYQAKSENGIDWDMQRDPIFSGNDLMPYFVLGKSQLSLFANADDDAVYLAFSVFSFPAFQNSIITAVSEDHENWELTNTTLVRPNGNVDNFDGGAVYSPNLSLINGQHVLLYCGINERDQYDFIFEHAGKSGVKTSDDGAEFDRFVGPRAGGSIIEPDNQVDWEEVFIFGGSLFEWNGQVRILYCASEEINQYGHTNSTFGFGLVTGIDFEPPNSAPIIPGNIVVPPAAFYLDPAYPNPFNSAISIPFHMNNSTKVKFSILTLMVENLQYCTMLSPIRVIIR
jgi:predicted GH43/DUF377 family glycosyl hydrolase